MKNLPLFENASQYYKLDERFDELYESASNNFKFLVSSNPQLMRQLFNQMSQKGYILTPNVYFDELSPEAALKIKIPNIIQIWLNANDEIQIITLDNEVMDTSITKIENKSLSKSQLPYFYPSSFFGSTEAFDYIKQNGSKIKPFLLGCNKVYAFSLAELGKKNKPTPSQKIDYIIDRFATKYKIPVHQASILSKEEILSIVKDQKNPAYLVNPDTFSLNSYLSNHDLFKTDSNISGITDDTIKALMRDFIVRLPLLRGSKLRDSTYAIVHKTSGTTHYEVNLTFDNDYNYSVLPNVALIQSILDMHDVSISKSFYSTHFVKFDIIIADSPKEAKMNTMDWWTAFVNVSRDSEEFKRALSDAAPEVKRLAAQVGKETLLLAKNGNTEIPEFKQFFTDILMYKTGADKLPGKQIDIYSQPKKLVLFQ